MEQKPKIFNINNFLASETGRLSSLSIKRDLSLGGNKQKKVYKPNLNVVRNKNKVKIAINNKMQQNQIKRNTRASPNRNHQTQCYVQSSSVFSEGAGEFKRPTIHSDRYLTHGDRDQTIMTMPKIIKNLEVNMQEEKNVIDELLAEDEGSSSENEGDYSPVVLPLRDNKDGFQKTFKIKKEDSDKIDIKEENSSCVYKFSDNVLNYESPLSFQDNKLYDEDHPCISLIRLPDSLPGKGFIEDSDEVVDFSLNQMIEGKIGKVLIKKSGKVEVQIGNTRYILDSIESNPFKEDLMYIANSNSFGPDMANLANIDEKYILSPSWKNLFTNEKK